MGERVVVDAVGPRGVGGHLQLRRSTGTRPHQGTIERPECLIGRVPARVRVRGALGRAQAAGRGRTEAAAASVAGTGQHAHLPLRPVREALQAAVRLVRDYQGVVQSRRVRVVPGADAERVHQTAPKLQVRCQLAVDVERPMGGRGRIAGDRRGSRPQASLAARGAQRGAEHPQGRIEQLRALPTRRPGTFAAEKDEVHQRTGRRSGDRNVCECVCEYITKSKQSFSGGVAASTSCMSERGHTRWKAGSRAASREPSAHTANTERSVDHARSNSSAGKTKRSVSIASDGALDPHETRKRTGLEASPVADHGESAVSRRAEHLVGIEPAQPVVAAHAPPLSQHLHALEQDSHVKDDLRL